MKFAPRKFLRVGGGVLKIKVTVTMADPGVAKEFRTKEILAWGGGVWKIKVTVTMADTGIAKEFRIKEILAWGGRGLENKNFFDHG